MSLDTERLVGELRQIVNIGIGGVDTDTEIPQLAALHWVRAHAGDASSPLLVAKAAEELVKQAARTLPSPAYSRACEILLGAHPSTAVSPAKVRRERAAQALNVDPETFQRHEQKRVLRFLARRVADIELDYRANEGRLGPPPSPSEVAQRWTERFRHYAVLQMHLRQMRHEIIEALLASSEMPDEVGRVDARDTSLWRYAKFLEAREALIADVGRPWYFPSAGADGVAERAIDDLRFHTPFNERARSLLRSVLRSVPGEEMYPFAEELKSTPHGMEVVGVWEAWLAECDGDLERDDPHCSVHKVVDRSDEFVRTVEEQWELIQDRYR